MMRSLTKNKSKLYYVRRTGITENTDSFGNYTGELKSTYASPVEINLCVMPNNGAVIRDFKGELSRFNLIATDVSHTLQIGDLLFKQSPSSNYDKTYDYEVVNILRSLSNSMYILKARV